MEHNRKGGNKRHVEYLAHFQCPECTGWWSVGDAPEGKKEWYCPWCGARVSA